jgi:hypothetical protein
MAASAAPLQILMLSEVLNFTEEMSDLKKGGTNV